MSTNSLKLLATAASLLVAAVVLVPQDEAKAAAATDPNITQRVQQFIWKPAPGDLLLKPKPKKHPKPKDAKN
jgi:hypothetical protein